MSENKTRKTDMDIEHFLQSVDNTEKQRDSRQIVQLMARVTGEPPVMWGDSIIGFGEYAYRYASGRTGEWFLTGFSPRKQNLTLYIMAGFDRYDSLLKKLGKFKTGKSCLYIKRLEDIDTEVLEQLIRASIEHMKESHH